MEKRLLVEVSKLQKIAGIRSKGVNLEEDDYDMGSRSGDTDAMGDTDVMNIAEEKVSTEEIIKTYIKPLHTALKARQADKEDTDAYYEVKDLITKIAKEAGIADAENIPWMEDEMFSGDYSPKEVILYLKDMLDDSLSDASLDEDTTMPGEEVRMKNYLKRGSRDQTNLHPNPFTVVGSQKGTIEGKGPLNTSNHPENKNTSQRYNNGYPWSWDQANLFEDGDMRKYLIGREFQTLDDLRKMVIRLRSAGYPDMQINDFILNYIA